MEIAPYESRTGRVRPPCPNRRSANSLLRRQRHERERPEKVADETQRMLAAERVLEVLYSARSAPDYDAIAAELSALHAVPCDAQKFERALAVQRSLAHVGGLHHRSVTIADLIIAAAAASRLQT